MTDIAPGDDDLPAVAAAELDAPVTLGKPRRRRPLALMLSAVGTALFLALALIGPMLVGDPTEQHPSDGYRPPAWMADGSKAYLLGTDQLGRDIFTRVVVGLQSSVLTALVAVSIAAVAGILVGLFAGFYGKWVDELVMRLVDVQMAIPAILLLLLVVAILNPSFPTVVMALAALTWIVYVRVTRGEVLAIKQNEMITGLVAMGASNRRIVFRHILANIAGPLIVITAIEFAQVVIAGASLSYLGLGIPPPTPTLGGMISDGQGGLTAGLWWPVLVPGALLAAMVVTINALGESLRAYLDPRSKVSRTRVSRRRPMVVSGGEK